MPKNKYIEMMDKDENIILYNKLYKDIENISKDIQELNSTIGNLIQDISNNLIKDKRIFFLINYEINLGRWGYKYHYNFGLGTYGWGNKSSSYGTNLGYDWQNIFRVLDHIIKSKDEIRDGIKNMLLNRYDNIIKALEVYPIKYNELTTKKEFIGFTDKDFKKNCYDGCHIYTELLRGYSIELSLRVKDEDKEQIYDDNIEDIILYNHTFPIINKAMQEHIDKLNVIKDKLNKYMQSNEYRQLEQEKINIALLNSL